MDEDRVLPRLMWSVGLGAVALIVAVLVVGLVSRVIDGPTTTVRTSNPGDLIGEIIQVQVLNGGGVPGGARTMTAYLRDRGFDVVESGERRPFEVEETYIIDRVGNREAALRVARTLGLSESVIEEKIDPRYYVDATVVVGRDLDRLPAFARSSTIP